MLAIRVFIAVLLCAACASASSSLLKRGRKASINIDQINTPYGRSYLRKHAYEIIVPGTKWCGDGNIADDYEDLGYFEETDKCCRDHDHCDDVIEAGGENHGLNNSGLFTLLHCKCDLGFFDCLNGADCVAAGLVGTGYFNILNRQCYDFKHPATCVEYDTILGLGRRCIKYEYDTTQPEAWQWFDIPRYLFGRDDKNCVKH